MPAWHSKGHGTGAAAGERGKWRQPKPYYGIPGEAALVAKIRAILDCNPIEVNNLSSKFAAVFNEVVRQNEHTPFSPDKRNDGSFKKWLLSCGFEVGPVFERNRSLVYLPWKLSQAPQPAPIGEQHQQAEEPRRQRHRNKCRSSNESGQQPQWQAATGSACKGGDKGRWEIRHQEEEQASGCQMNLVAAAACFLSASAPPAATPVPATAEVFAAEQAPDSLACSQSGCKEEIEEEHAEQTLSTEPEPEHMELSTTSALSSEVKEGMALSEAEEALRQEDMAPSEAEQAPRQEDMALSEEEEAQHGASDVHEVGAAWFEVRPVRLEVDEDGQEDFILVGQEEVWEEALTDLPSGKGGFQIADEGSSGMESLVGRWLVEGLP